MPAAWVDGAIVLITVTAAAAYLIWRARRRVDPGAASCGGECNCGGAPRTGARCPDPRTK